MEIVLLVLYAVFLTFILFYSLIQFNLVVIYTRAKRHQPEDEKTPEAPQDWPFVTIQLPIYNEVYVVGRLVDTIAAFHYPKDKFEIQILDDSNDETIQLVADKVAEYKALGFHIEQIRRSGRAGYKAGALACGMKLAKGEFIAIFDADFVPTPDFLIKTIPHFYTGEKIGVVQTRWEHLNKDYSLLTRLQAVGLDAHFTVEQRGRNQGGHFINFNGTAGVWRKETITDAGGWQADTITEDLDLSYRAQIKGWRFKYLEGVVAPAELPAAMEALKSQQFRWTKGAAECTIKNMPRVWKAKGFSFGTKLHAFFHLMNSFIFVCILFSALLSIPLMFVKNQFQQYELLFQLASLYIVSFIILSIFYYTSLSRAGEGRWKNVVTFLRYFPLFLSVSMGLSLHNSIAVFEGYIGRKTAFVRTPKFNIHKTGDSWKGKKYLMNNISILTVLEGLMMLYFIWGIVLAFLIRDFGMLPFHIMLTFGFGFIFFSTIRHART